MAVATVLDSDVFRKTCGRFATGIAIATVTSLDGTPYGITVNSFTSVSAVPPLVLDLHRLSEYGSGSFPRKLLVLRERPRGRSAGTYRSGSRSAYRIDSRGLEWQHGASGVPVLDGCLANMECSVVQTIEAGDHAIFIAEVIHVRCREGKPLLYFAKRLLRSERLRQFVHSRGIFYTKHRLDIVTCCSIKVEKTRLVQALLLPTGIVKDTLRNEPRQW